MIERIRRLTDFQEAVLVIVIALGFFIYSSVHLLLIISTGAPRKLTYQFTEQGAIGMLIFEVVSLGLVGYILSKRDWKFEDLNLTISWRILLDAVLVIIVIILINGVVYGIITTVVGTEKESVSSLRIRPHTNLLIWGVMLVVNSVFEEFIYIGYLF